MSKFKVGDRVRAKNNDSIGTVISIEERQLHTCILVKFDTWHQGHNGSDYYETFGFEYDDGAKNHWWFNDYQLVLADKSKKFKRALR